MYVNCTPFCRAGLSSLLRHRASHDLLEEDVGGAVNLLVGREISQ